MQLVLRVLQHRRRPLCVGMLLLSSPNCWLEQLHQRECRQCYVSIIVPFSDAVTVAESNAVGVAVTYVVANSHQYSTANEIAASYFITVSNTLAFAVVYTQSVADRKQRIDDRNSRFRYCYDVAVGNSPQQLDERLGRRRSSISDGRQPGHY